MPLKMDKSPTLSGNLTKVQGIEQSFFRSKTFSFNKIMSHFISLMTKIFCFTRISQILTAKLNKEKKSLMADDSNGFPTKNGRRDLQGSGWVQTGDKVSML